MVQPFYQVKPHRERSSLYKKNTEVELLWVKSAKELSPTHCIPIWILTRALRGPSMDLHGSLEHGLQMYRVVKRTQALGWDMGCVPALLLAI